MSGGRAIDVPVRELVMEVTKPGPVGARQWVVPLTREEDPGCASSFSRGQGVSFKRKEWSDSSSGPI